LYKYTLFGFLEVLLANINWRTGEDVIFRHYIYSFIKNQWDDYIFLQDSILDFFFVASM